MTYFILILVMCTAMVYGQTDCPPKTGQTSVQDTAIEFTKTCSFTDLELIRKKVDIRGSLFASTKYDDEAKKFNLEGFEKSTPEELCSCVTNNKNVNDAKVDQSKINSFDQKSINESIEKNFKFALKNLFMNVTKFKNLGLEGDLHKSSLKMCNVDSIVTSMKELNGKEGTADCPGSKEEFKSRLDGIFGEKGIDNAKAALDSEFLNVDQNSCISRQEFLRLRSSDKTANFVMGFVRNGSIKSFFSQDDSPDTEGEFTNLLSYDLFFSLGYQDKKFNDQLRYIITTPKYSAPGLVRNYEDIYSDSNAQGSAYASIQRSCENIKKHMKSYLCSSPAAAIDSKNLNLALSEKFKDGEFFANQAMKDFYTEKYACSKNAIRNPENKEFNEFLESNTMAAKAFPDVISSDPKSEYSSFNATFCNGRKNTRVTSNDLADMMKDFFDKNKDMKLMEFFRDPNIAISLNLNINPYSRPTFSRAVVENGITKLPEINKGGWAVVAQKLRDEKHMSENDIAQLYAIIEMQTNARSTELKVITEKFKGLHPEMKEISPVQVDAMLRGYSTTNMSFAKIYPSTVTTLNQVQQIEIDERARRQERFAYVPQSDAVPTPGVTSNHAQVPVVTEAILNNKEAKALEKSAPESTQNSTPDKKTAATTSDSQNKTTSPQLIVSNSSTSSSTSPSYVSSSGSSSSSQEYVSPQDSDSYSNTQSDLGSSSSGRTTYNSSSSSSSGSSSYDNDINRLRDEIASSQKRLEDARRVLNNNVSSNVPSPRNSVRNPKSSYNPNYQYPKNLPIKTQDGDYYRPETRGSELSSASEKNQGSSENNSQASSAASAGKGGKGAVASSGGPVSFGSSGSSGGGKVSNGRTPASETSSVSTILKDVAPFELDHFIPHSVFDVVGSIDKVILLLGLEGKRFKTIEAIEVPEKATGKIKITYYERTFDFVPAGKFEKFKDLFSTKESRTDAFKQYFTYSRDKSNLPMSKQYSLATREIEKTEVSHDYVLKIQNYILSDDELRDTINKGMELIK